MHMSMIKNFFLKDIISIKHIIDTFFSRFSELKPNLRKSEIVGIVVLKGVHVAVFRMRCIDLNIDTLKYQVLISLTPKNRKKINFYNIVTGIHRELKIWKTRKLTL